MSILGIGANPPDSRELAWSSGEGGAAKDLKPADAAIKALAQAGVKIFPSTLDRLMEEGNPLGRTLGSAGSLARFQSDAPGKPSPEGLLGSTDEGAQAAHAHHDRPLDQG